MRQNFKASISFDKKTVHAIIVPQHRHDGMYYEVNISEFQRFYMTWSPLGRYDIVAEKGLNIPDSVVLAVSDAIEERS